MNLDQFSRANESAKDVLLKSRLSSHSLCVLVHRAVIFTFADFPGSSKNLYYFSERRFSYNSFCSFIKLTDGFTYIIFPSKSIFHSRRGVFIFRLYLSRAKSFTLLPRVLSTDFGYVGVAKRPTPGICN